MAMSISRVFITWIAVLLMMATPTFTGWFFFKFWGFIGGLILGIALVILCFEGFCIFVEATSKCPR